MEGETIDALLSRLQPYLDLARKAGTDVLGDVGGALTEKAVGGLTSIGVRTAGAVHRGMRNRFQRSRALTKFQKEIEQAESTGTREAAFRKFLQSDPFLRDSLAALLERRDYLRALRAWCDELPMIDLVPGDHRLEEVFVRPVLIAAGNPTAGRPATSMPEDLLEGGHQFVHGDAGSGKSTLARWLVGQIANRLLSDNEAPALDQLRLPVYVAASMLESRSWAQALRDASDSLLGLRELSPLSSGFFDPRAPHGHRQWTVVIDGLDEIDDPRRKQAIWRAITAVHAADSDAFQFIVFSRPDPALQPPEGFTCWRMAPLTDIGSMIRRYARSAEAGPALATLLARQDYSEVSRNPLFVAMAAALFERHTTLPTRPHELIEAYVAHGLQRVAQGDACRYTALSLLLTDLARAGAAGGRALLASNPEASADVTTRFSTLEREAELEHVLRETGLVRLDGGKALRFLHRLIERYFVANALAERALPSPDVWREVDPAQLGWAAIEQLCGRWVERGLPVEAAIHGLADYGSEASEVILRLAAHLPDIDDYAFARPFDALVKEAEAGELTVSQTEFLPILMRERRVLRERLVAAAKRDELGYVALPIAAALGKAGYFSAIRSQVRLIAEGESAGSYFQIEAAQLLLDYADENAALEILWELAETAETAGGRFQAAYQLHRRLRTDETLSLLHEIVREVELDPEDRLNSQHLSMLLEMGEAEVALPLLREAANTFDDDTTWLGGLEAIRAAELLAGYDLVEGKAALEQLLGQPRYDLREQAEILSALDRLDPLGGYRARLTALVRATPHQIGNRVVDILLSWNLVEIAWAAVEIRCRKAFEQPHISMSALGPLARVLPMIDQQVGAALLREGLSRHQDPELARLLAVVGLSSEARTRLTPMLDFGNFQLGISAARALAQVGDGAKAVLYLSGLAQSQSASEKLRFEAAAELIALSEDGLAGTALREMLSSPSLAFEYRRLAAFRLLEIEKDEGAGVLERLGKIARQGPIADRLAAMQTIAEIDPYLEDYFLLCRPLSHLVALKGFNHRHLAAFAELAQMLDMDIGDFPKVLDLLSSGELTASETIDLIEEHALGALSQEWVVTLLRTIIHAPETDLDALARAVALLGSARGDDTDKLLDQLAADPSLPPRWRVDLANASSPERALPQLAALANEDSLAVRFRLEAFDLLRLRGVDCPLPEFDQQTDLDVYERTAIARAAHGVGQEEIARAHLKICFQLTPLAAHELVEIHGSAVACGHLALVELAATQLAVLPLAIIEQIEDTSTAIDAIAIMATTDQSAAFDRLAFLLASEEMSIWSLPELLEAMACHRTREEVRADALPVLEETLGYLDEGGEYPGAMLYAVEPLFKAGWLEDVEPLFRLSRDPKRRASERIGAAALALSCVGGGDHDARLNLQELLESPMESASDGIEAAVRLLRHGFEAQALQLAETCLTRPDLAPIDRLRIAGLLDKLGRKYDSLRLIGELHLDSLHDASLHGTEYKLLEEAFGAQRLRDFRETRSAASENEIDRLLEARAQIDDRGSRSAMATVLELATNSNTHPADRLEAVDVLDGLGFRALGRSIFDELDFTQCEPLWVAMQAARFGQKELARDYFLRAVKVETLNPQLVRTGLADLGIVLPEDPGCCP